MGDLPVGGGGMVSDDATPGIFTVPGRDMLEGKPLSWKVAVPRWAEPLEQGMDIGVSTGVTGARV
jgi:hypothetical protein